MIKAQHRWSISLRLVFIYTLSAFILLLLCVFSLYWMFSSRLEKENIQFLADKVLVIQKILQNQPIVIPALREEVLSEPAIYHYYVRIIAATGKIFIETPHMQTKIPAFAFNNVTAKTAAPFNITHWSEVEKDNTSKKYYLLMTAIVNVQSTNTTNYLIQMAIDISKEQKIIEDYQNDLTLVLLLGIILSAAVGVLVTRQGLQPLNEITRSAHRITLSQLEERLEPTTLPKELAVLAIAFNKMLDRIQEGFTRLKQFSEDLAHEFRTPINNLMGEAEIILSKPRDNAEYRQTLESIVEEFERLSQMIENILFLARSENPQQAMKYTVIKLDEMFSDIIDFFNVVADEKQISLRWEVKNNLSIKADATMLRRALSNLIANALKYTSAGGKITLSAHTKKDTVEISVRDTGIGIAAEHIPHLFDRFYRVDSARSHHTGGTGLGLALVKLIMDLHHGNVTITSEINQGTVVTLIFPYE